MRGRTTPAFLATIFLAAGTVAVLAQAPASPPALYTAAQAETGAPLYQSQCAACHGAALEGTAAPALQGTGFVAMATAQNMNAESLLAITAQTMPQGQPGTLPPEQYAAIVAYILQQNGYPAGTEELSAANPHLKELGFSK